MNNGERDDLNSPRPLSDAESLAAAKIYRRVAKGEIEWAQARAQLEELFGDEVVRRAIVDQQGRASGGRLNYTPSSSRT